MTEITVERINQMTRVYSPEEQESLTTAENELREQGLLVDNDTGTNQDAANNVFTIFNYFETHRNVPVTVGNIRIVVKAFADQLAWVSQTAKDYYKQDAAEIALVNKWFEQGSGRSLISDGEPGRENTLNLLNFCRKVGGVDWQNLNRAIDALNPLQALPGVNTPTLHWKTTTPSGSFTNKTGLPNHAENYQPEQKQEHTRKYINGRLNHAWVDPNAPTAPLQVDPNEGGGWRQVCEALAKDGSHADQAEISQVMNRARTSGKSWLETYQLMKQTQQDRAGFRNFDRKGL
jgi:hypothetical protein